MQDRGVVEGGQAPRKIIQAEGDADDEGDSSQRPACGVSLNSLRSGG